MERRNEYLLLFQSRWSLSTPCAGFFAQCCIYWIMQSRELLTGFICVVLWTSAHCTVFSETKKHTPVFTYTHTIYKPKSHLFSSAHPSYLLSCLVLLSFDLIYSRLVSSLFPSLIIYSCLFWSCAVLSNLIISWSHLWLRSLPSLFFSPLVFTQLKHNNRGALCMSTTRQAEKWSRH